MKTIDSKTKKLDGPVIIAEAVKQGNTAGHPPATALAAVAAETQLDDALLKQFGNTVFLSHRGKEKNRNKMIGRAFNVDTGKNFITNALDFISYLQEQGITHYTTWFVGADFLNAFRFFQRMTRKKDTQIGIAERDEGGYIVYIKIGKDPIPEGF
tara:strand:+ start:2499 stop:2963 length:465 start_codon:yes stop_codon:yes gene_type:complete